MFTTTPQSFKLKFNLNIEKKGEITLRDKLN
jgi:hypothetical protein